MSQIPEEADAIVVIFVMDGCGHCHNFMPTFLRVAQSWDQTVPYYVVKADDPNPEIQRLADRLKIEATPTTAAIRRRAHGAIKVVGAATTKQLNDIFQSAHAINTGSRR